MTETCTPVLERSERIRSRTLDHGDAVSAQVREFVGGESDRGRRTRNDHWRGQIAGIDAQLRIRARACKLDALSSRVVQRANAQDREEQ